MVVAAAHEECPYCGTAIAKTKVAETTAKIRAEEQRREARANEKYEVALKEAKEKIAQADIDRAAFDLKLKQSVEAATAAFYDYVAADSGAFRLVFESDLTNEPAVRDHVDRVTTECADMIAEVIREDTGLPDEASRLLAVSLVGMAQVSARFWMKEGGEISRADAGALVAGLAWRGIRGYPLTDEH